MPICSYPPPPVPSHLLGSLNLGRTTSFSLIAPAADMQSYLEHRLGVASCLITLPTYMKHADL
jgi:hypothetical protein